MILLALIIMKEIKCSGVTYRRLPNGSFERVYKLGPPVKVNMKQNPPCQWMTPHHKEQGTNLCGLAGFWRLSKNFLLYAGVCCIRDEKEPGQLYPDLRAPKIDPKLVHIPQKEKST